LNQSNMSKQEKAQLIQKVELALDDVRPHLAVDGGDVELVDVTDDLRVQVRWLGTCESCQMSAMTLKAGIEQTILGRVPEIMGVEAVNEP